MENNSYYPVSDDEIFEKPIDYVSLEKSDFPDLEVKKDVVDIPDGKYLKDVLIQNGIHPQESNTVVINSSVGQGKSYLAIEIANRYLTRDAYKGKYGVIFVAPHKSLVKQYTTQFKQSFKYKIPNYEYLTDVTYDETPNAINTKEAKSPNNINFNCRFPLHIITVDCLLGSAGDAIEQSSIKRKYLENFISFSKRNKCKIVLIFDEIHDAIDNFKPELIPNLWKFQTSGVLHKTFILSATFSVASKVVIGYISALTDKRLHIIETVRKQQSQDKLSNLHLHITQQRTYKFEEPEFIGLFEKIIETHEFINILTSSAKLATKIAHKESKIRKLLDSKKHTVNLCIANNRYIGLDRKKDFAPILFKSEYLSDNYNIGTIFKTGISINQKGSALVIILPSSIALTRGIITRSGLGIFSSGVIDVIQALARVRDKSDIYIIMPTPQRLIIPALQDSYNSDSYNYLTLLPQLEILKTAKDKTIAKINQRAEKSSNIIDTYDEIEFNNQKSLIEKKYDQIKDKIESEITAKHLSEGENSYPSLNQFILTKGEKMLCSYYAIFGKDLPAYMIWAAFNNQFVNCRVKSISSTKDQEEQEDNNDTIQDILYALFMQNYAEQPDNIEVCDYQLYKNFYEIIQANKFYLNTKIPVRDSNNKLHCHIMAFIQKSLKGNDRLNTKYHKEDEFGHIQDIPFEAEDYLMCCIANTYQYTEGEFTGASEPYHKLIISYQKLNEIRLKLFIDKLVMVNPDNNKTYIYRDFKKYSNLNSDQIKEIIETVQVIYENDIFFQYFEKLQKIDFYNIDTSFTSIYNLLRNTFFRVTLKNQKEPTEIAREKGYESKNRPHIDYVESTQIPSKRTGINLLYKYNYVKEENYEDLIYKEITDSMDAGTTDITFDDLPEDTKKKISIKKQTLENTAEGESENISIDATFKNDGLIGDVIVDSVNEDQEPTENDIEINNRIKDILDKLGNQDSENKP